MGKVELVGQRSRSHWDTRPEARSSRETYVARSQSETYVPDFHM